jgi:hypothetical protein
LNNILRWMFQNINEISITGQVKIFIYWIYSGYAEKVNPNIGKELGNLVTSDILFMKIAVATFMVHRKNKCQD